jgi:hypothetical protein
MSLFNGFDRIGSDQIDMPQKIYRTPVSQTICCRHSPRHRPKTRTSTATQNMIISSGTARGHGIRERRRHRLLPNAVEGARAPLRKLQLNERLFKTVPYLGRIMQSRAGVAVAAGDVVTDKKARPPLWTNRF